MIIRSQRDKEIDLEVVKKINASATDWTAVCPICGEVLSGTPAQLAEHKHVK